MTKMYLPIQRPLKMLMNQNIVRNIETISNTDDIKTKPAATDERGENDHLHFICQTFYLFIQKTQEHHEIMKF